MKNYLIILFWVIGFNISAQVLVKNIAPGLTPSYPHMFYPFKGNLVFAANDSYNGYQLFYTDGTAGGTVMLTHLYSLGPFIYQQVQQINQCINNSPTGFNFVEIDSLGYFFAVDSLNGYKLWKTDGTAAGTNPISPTLNYNVNTSRIFKMQNYICSEITWGGDSLLRYNPSTQTVSIIAIQSLSGYYNSSIISQHLVSMLADDIYLDEPYIYNNKFYKRASSICCDSTIFYTVDVNGISNIVAQLPYVWPDMISILGKESSIIISNKLLFYPQRTNEAFGREPHVFDFATNTISLLKDINPYFNYSSDTGGTGFIPFEPFDNYNHKQSYFIAFNPDYGNELWVTDGTTAGTNMVEDYTPGPLSIMYKFDFVHYNDSLLLLKNNLSVMWPCDSVLLGTHSSISFMGYINTFCQNGCNGYNYLFHWVDNNSIYFLDPRGNISKVGSCLVIDSLNKLNCSRPDIMMACRISLSCFCLMGTILKVNNRIYLSYDDCSYTGYELYKLDLATSVPFYYGSANSLTISPNPLTSSSILQLNNQLKNAEVAIYNVLGKEVMRRKMDGDRMEIERGCMESGVYFVMVRTEEKQWVEKMVVE